MISEEPNILYSLAENGEAIGILYQEYAKQFPDYESFWIGLASDEKEHARWIRKLYSTATAGSALSFNPKRFNKEAIQTYFNYLQRELVKVKQGETTLINALSTTLYIEESLIERKFLDVFETDSIELKHVLLDFAASTRAHLDRARETLSNYKQIALMVNGLAFSVRRLQKGYISFKNWHGGVSEWSMVTVLKSVSHCSTQSPQIRLSATLFRRNP